MGTDKTFEIQTAFGSLKVKADPKLKLGEIEFRREYLGQWAEPSSDQKRSEPAPDLLHVGDRIRWWPDGKDDAGRPRVNRCVDGTIERMPGRHPLVRAERVTGGLEESFGFVAGALLDASVFPGAIERWCSHGDWSHLGPCTAPADKRSETPPDPLDVEYDGVTLRDLLALRENVNREQDVGTGGPCPIPWRNADPWTWTPRPARRGLRPLVGRAPRQGRCVGRARAEPRGGRPGGAVKRYCTDEWCMGRCVLCRVTAKEEAQQVRLWIVIAAVAAMATVLVLRWLT